MVLQFPAGEVDIPDARSHTTRVDHATQAAVNSVRRDIEYLIKHHLPQYGGVMSVNFEHLVRLIASGGRAA